jgi:O-antigen/teichoic acid export membrane protein
MLLMANMFVRSYGFPHFSMDAKRLKAIFREAAPIGVSFVMIQIYQYLDTVMLGFMRSGAEVGYYVGANKLMVVTVVPAGLIFGAFFPSLSRKGDVGMPGTVRNYGKIMFMTGLPISVLGTLFAPELTLFFYGAQYEQASVPFTILMLNPILVYANMTLGNPLIAWDRQRSYMRWITLGVLTNVVLNLFLIPMYGAIGAAVTTVLTEFSIFWGLRHESRKAVKVSLVDLLWRPFVWSTIMVVICLGLRDLIGFRYFIVIMLVGSLVYLTGMLLTDGFLMRNFRLLFRSN